MSTAGGPKATHQDSPAPFMQAIIDASLPSGSSHSSFSVEFRDSSESHGQVECASTSTSGVEFQITRGSSDIMPSTASHSDGDRGGAGRDGAVEHIRMPSLRPSQHVTVYDDAVSPAGGCAGVVLPSAQLFIQMQLCRKDSLRDWLRTSVETRSRRTVLLYFEQVGFPPVPL